MIEAATYATPDKVFPAITLLLLAYVNRFSALSAKTREFKEKKGMASKQTLTMLRRVRLAKYTLMLGMTGVLVALLDFVAIAAEAPAPVYLWLVVVASALVASSLVTAIMEVAISTDALDEEIGS